VGLLPAQISRVTQNAPLAVAADPKRSFRNVLAVLGLALWLLCYVPPLWGWSERFEYVQALQFLSFAVLVPALLATGAPWHLLGLASSRASLKVDEDGHVLTQRRLRPFERHAITRTRQESNRRVAVLMTSFLALLIFWRVAPVVDFEVRHGFVVLIESWSLVGSGLALWLDLVNSPPLSPGTTRPYRIGMATISMWAVWILAYLDAMSHSSWYNVFHHIAGHGISQSADQQFTAAAMWLFSAGAFLPVIFWNLIHWLQSEENPSDELQRMVRREKTYGPYGELP